MAGIYLHIPYCKVKCHYCDFHFSTRLDGKNNLLDNMMRELNFRKDYLEGEEVKTIYFGGGTPSLLSEKELNKLLETIHQLFPINNEVEVTFECNPDDLSKQKLIELKQVGVNRLSIGTQSFHEDLLKFMNRAHTANEAFDSIKQAKDIGFDNITIDLIYGIPGSTMETWKRDLDYLKELDVPHLSAYCLTIEQGTVFGNWKENGKLTPFPDEDSLRQFEYLLKFTNEHGMEQYEISNFAKTNFVSKHNSAYWLGKSYLGIGPSAHSYNGHSRQWNIPNNLKYNAAINSDLNALFEKEELSVSDRFNEYILTRLRTKWGIDSNDLKKISEEMWADMVVAVTPHLEKESLNLVNGVYKLTEKGKFIADAISADLFQ